MASTPIAVRFPESIAQRLDNLAARTRRSKAVYIREAVERQLDQIEWEQGILQEVEDVRSGRAKTISEAELRQSLGLDS